MFVIPSVGGEESSNSSGDAMVDCRAQGGRAGLCFPALFFKLIRKSHIYMRAFIPKQVGLRSDRMNTDDSQSFFVRFGCVRANNSALVALHSTSPSVVQKDGIQITSFKVSPCNGKSTKEGTVVSRPADQLQCFGHHHDRCQL